MYHLIDIFLCDFSPNRGHFSNFIFKKTLFFSPKTEEDHEGNPYSTATSEVSDPERPLVLNVPRRRSSINRAKLIEMNRRLDQQYRDDKRFHPVVIGNRQKYVLQYSFLGHYNIF